MNRKKILLCVLGIIPLILFFSCYTKITMPPKPKKNPVRLSASEQQVRLSVKYLYNIGITTKSEDESECSPERADVFGEGYELVKSEDFVYNDHDKPQRQIVKCDWCEVEFLRINNKIERSILIKVKENPDKEKRVFYVYLQNYENENYLKIIQKGKK